MKSERKPPLLSWSSPSRRTVLENMAFICTRPNKCANWQSLVCRCPLFAFRPPLIGRRFKNNCCLLSVKESSLFLLSDFVFFSCVFYLILRFFLCLLSDLVCSWYGPGNKKGHEPLNPCPHFRRKCSYSLSYLRLKLCKLFAHLIR